MGIAIINTQTDVIRFQREGSELETAIRRALEAAAETLLEQLGLTRSDLESVTTRTHLRAAFAKFVFLRVLHSHNVRFDDVYVNSCFGAYACTLGEMSREQFEFITAADKFGPLSYKASYANVLKTGLGLFLLALHSDATITLPMSFRWPSLREPNAVNRRREVGRLLCSELLAFVRELDSQSIDIPHPAFSVVGKFKKRREWFLTYATKLLLACGWHKPEDVNGGDLLQIRLAQERLKRSGGKEYLPHVYRALLEVLCAKYGPALD